MLARAGLGGALPAARGSVSRTGLTGAALAAAAAAAPPPSRSGARSVAGLVLVGVTARPGRLRWRSLRQCGRLEHHHGRLEGRRGDRRLRAASGAAAGRGARLGGLVRRNHGHSRDGAARGWASGAARGACGRAGRLTAA